MVDLTKFFFSEREFLVFPHCAVWKLNHFFFSLRFYVKSILYWRMQKLKNAIFAISGTQILDLGSYMSVFRKCKNSWIKSEFRVSKCFWTCCKEIDFTENLSSRIFLKFPHFVDQTSNFSKNYLDLEHYCLSPLKFFLFFLIFNFLLGISTEKMAAGITNPGNLGPKWVFGPNWIFQFITNGAKNLEIDFIWNLDDFFGLHYYLGFVYYAVDVSTHLLRQYFCIFTKKEVQCSKPKEFFLNCHFDQIWRFKIRILTNFSFIGLKKGILN